VTRALAVKEDTLTDMVICLTETTGLVHQMPFVCDREGFSGVLEKVGFCSAGFFTFRILWYLLVYVQCTCSYNLNSGCSPVEMRGHMNQCTGICWKYCLPVDSAVH